MTYGITTQDPLNDPTVRQVLLNGAYQDGVAKAEFDLTYGKGNTLPRDAHKAQGVWFAYVEGYCQRMRQK